MQDIALNQLISALQQIPSEQLCAWFADENSLGVIAQLAELNPRILIFTNRYDIHQLAKRLGLASTFNDADLSPIAALPISHLFARISKEKPLTHHIINQAMEYLPASGTLHLAGLKSEGIKTYLKKTESLFNGSLNSHKNKDAHYKAFKQPIFLKEALLDTLQYENLRLIAQLGDKMLMSKPGVFGFEKIDEGSALLLKTAQHYLTENKIEISSQLDLGCGYGLLTIGSAHWGATKFVATDNNAAALLAIRASAEINTLDISIVADDAGLNIQEAFDCILCNPPFHQGFSISDDLTHKFLKSASQNLHPHGLAFFVVNSFIGIEKKAANYFKEQFTLINNKQFKVIVLKKPLKSR